MDRAGHLTISVANARSSTGSAGHPTVATPSPSHTLPSQFIPSHLICSFSQHIRQAFSFLFFWFRNQVLVRHAWQLAKSKCLLRVPFTSAYFCLSQFTLRTNERIHMGKARMKSTPCSYCSAPPTLCSSLLPHLCLDLHWNQGKLPM